MRFTARDLQQLALQIETAFNDLQSPKGPTPVFACTTANMPPAASYPNCVLLNQTLNILAHSDGTSWIREDTGAAI